MEEVLERGDVRVMAEFFDHTDTGELDLEPVDDLVAGPELEQISIRLPKEDLEASAGGRRGVASYTRP